MARRVAVSVILVVVMSQAMNALTISVSRDRFSVDGKNEFLVFVSYFDGLNRPLDTLTADLTWLAARGVDGIRVWPNLGVPIMDASGALNPSRVVVLRALIDRAARHGLVVDVSFHREGVCGPPSDCGFTIEEFRRGIASLAAAVSDYRNVLFDLQNEWDVHGQPMTLTDLRGILEAVKAVNPVVVVTASTTAGYGEAQAAADAFDAVAFHGARDRHGRWAEDTDDLVARLRGHLAASPKRPRPVYLQEPNRFKLEDEHRPEMDNNTESYLIAARNAKQAGAAAWTFHTGASFELAGSSPLPALLQPGELEVLNKLSATVSAVPWGHEAGSGL